MVVFRARDDCGRPFAQSLCESASRRDDTRVAERDARAIRLRKSRQRERDRSSEEREL